LRRFTRSDQIPEMTLRIAAVDSATPSMTPSEIAPAPKLAARNTGSSG
jgi:hypothetical protein